jgi:sterol desaturase/sphingolipid hydroxylase (fatty acid hydroxylase superfamily)
MQGPTPSLAHSEVWLRLAPFLAILAAMAVAEARWPRRARRVTRRSRWGANLGIVALNSLLVRLFVPVAPVGAALWCETQGWGLLPLLGLPAWLSIASAVVLLDLTVYLQHRLFHRVPLLWRIHRVHHADVELDVSSGLRFHPAEILLSVGIKLAAVVALGAPAEAVLGFEVLLNGTAMFNHANLRLPTQLDRWLRGVVVTPDMHRVHHSVKLAETHSNYGFCLPFWDRWMGTYRDQPARGHEAMEIGLPEFRGQEEQALGRLLVQPFRPLPEASLAGQGCSPP